MIHTEVNNLRSYEQCTALTLTLQSTVIASVRTHQLVSLKIELSWELYIILNCSDVGTCSSTRIIHQYVRQHLFDDETTCSNLGQIRYLDGNR